MQNGCVSVFVRVSECVSELMHECTLVVVEPSHQQQNKNLARHYEQTGSSTLGSATTAPRPYLGNAEVTQEHGHLGVKQDVFWLQIAMHHVNGM